MPTTRYQVLIAVLAICFFCTKSDLLLADPERVKPLDVHRVIVKYRPGFGAHLGAGFVTTMLTEALGLQSPQVQYIRAMSGDAHVLDVRSSSGFSMPPGVEYLVPDRMVQPSLLPDDNLYSQQWNFFEAIGGINSPTAWETTTGDSKVRIGVVDTGYRPHADLVDNLLPGYDFISVLPVANDGDGVDADASDPGDWTTVGECGEGLPAQDSHSTWHGTHVAGIIAAKTNNGVGVAGVAGSSKIVPVRVLGKCGGYSSDVIDGMRWAAGLSVPGVPKNPNPVRVINMSLGASGPCDAAYTSAIKDVNAVGAVVVVAAGNSNQDADDFTPASCLGAIAVAATDKTGGRAQYSNYGAVIAIAAPGGDTRTGIANGILSTLNTGLREPGEDTYTFYQGTSMAAPHVAGTVALMLSANPRLTPVVVKALLQQSARAFPSSGTIPCAVGACGAGLLDAAAAVKAAIKGTVDPVPGAVMLQNGIPQVDLFAHQKQWLRYTFAVLTDVRKLKVEIRGGVGDADMFIKEGTPASRFLYDAKSDKQGNNDTIELTNPHPGIYHIGVYAYKPFQGVALVTRVE